MSNNSNRLISISVDLTKIPASALITGKNGGKYANLDVTIKDEPDQYGQDCSVAVRQSKEERDDKQPRIFCGNGKKMFGWGNSAPIQSAHNESKQNGYAPKSAADDFF